MPAGRQMEIRQFGMEDYGAVIALWEQGGDGVHLRRSDTRPEIAKKLQRDPDLFLLAEEGGCLVGAVMGGFDGRRALVYHLVTDPAWRQQGVATALMEELESRLRAKGCLKVYLLVLNENHEAQEYYLKRGWEDMTVDLRIYGKEIA
jgi:ribosomal protein S18 acetylase RimI-like enzyme